MYPEASTQVPTIENHPTTFTPPRSRSRAGAVEGRVEAELERLVSLIVADREEVRTPDSSRPDAAQAIELSIVLLCRNDADTVGNCVLKAMYALQRRAIAGEVVVVDCRCQDDSIEIAEELGARIVHADSGEIADAVEVGLEFAQGAYVVFGPADESYDFSRAHQLYDKLQSGFDVVQGCRLRLGGGRSKPGAMHPLRQAAHALLGVAMDRWWGAPVRDPFCPVWGGDRQVLRERILKGGDLRGEVYESPALLAAARGERVAEVPITWHATPGAAPRAEDWKRRAMRRLRCLRAFLLMMPERSLLLPAAALALSGVVGLAGLAAGVGLTGGLATQTLVLSLAALLIALQMAGLSLLVRIAATDRGLVRPVPAVEAVVGFLTLGRTLRWASISVLAGFWAALQWNWYGATTWEIQHGGAAALASWSVMAAAILAGVQIVATGCLLRVLRWRWDA